MIEIVLQLPEASIDLVLQETMKEDKNSEEVDAIQTHAFLFIKEFRHFLAVQNSL